ncbi:MAG: porin [Hyphomicrobiales bacterium]|nr:porin [Hyphomicrobiales bacterium]
MTPSLLLASVNEVIECRGVLLRCMSAQVAQSGHASRVARCPLSGCGYNSAADHVARPPHGSGFPYRGRIWRRLWLVDELLPSHNSSMSRQGARIAKLGIFAATVVAAAGASCEMDVWAADVIPMTASATADSAPKPCTNLWDFVATNCQLTWQGITVYGTIDVGGGWQSHGAPFDPLSAAGASYRIRKSNRSSLWGLAPNGLSPSTIGIRGTEPIGGSLSFVFAVDAGFDPYSFRLTNGPGSAAANAGVPLNQQTAWADSSRAGQWYNGQGYLGISSPAYGTLTVFRQNALTQDAFVDYNPTGASLAFSPISGMIGGVGDTEDTRYSTSLKYRVNLGQFRAAALWQFGGYAQNNAANGAYQFQAGADIPTGKGVLSVDAIYSQVRDAVSTSVGPGSNDANGVPIPPFLPQTLRARISDNSSVMLLAKYAVGPLKLYGGYERIRFTAPSDPQTAFTNIAGTFLCEGCAAINNTDINNTAFGVDGLGNRIRQIMWTGVKYAVTDQLDVMVAYYREAQNSYFGTATGGPAPCSGSEHSQCAGTFNAISGVIDWLFAPKWDLYLGIMPTQLNGGLANGHLERNNIATTAGLRLRF